MMSSLTLDNSLLRPYQKGEFLQIDSSSTVCIITDPKEQNLPELLKQLPEIIAQIACNAGQTRAVEGRLHLHDRIVHLGAEVAEHNQSIENSLCVTILHVILLILTFGGFSYRESLRLEEPAKVPLASLFPPSFDPTFFNANYTADAFRALAEPHRKELASLLKLEEAQIAQILTGKFSEEATLADALKDKKPPSLAELLSSNTADQAEIRSHIAELSPKDLFSSVDSFTEEQWNVFYPDIAKRVAQFSATDLINGLGWQNLTVAQALSANTSSSRFVGLVTEIQWHGLPIPAFLFLTRCTWQKGASNSTVPVKTQISDAAFRVLYLQHDPLSVHLPDLLFGKNGGGEVLFSRLLPLSLQSLGPVLSQMGVNSRELRGKKREEMSGLLVNFSALISRQFSKDYIANVKKIHFETLVELWTSSTHPKVGAVNFGAWIARLSAEKRSSELYLLTTPSRETKEWVSFLGNSSADSLWSLLTALPYSGPKVDTAIYNPSSTQRAIEIGLQDPTLRIQWLCRLIPEAKWAEMMESGNVRQLAWLFQQKHENRLLIKEAPDQAKVSSALAALAKQELPDDLEFLSSLISGARQHLPKEGEMPPYKNAIDELIARASKKYSSEFATILADGGEADLFERDLSTLTKSLFIPILAANQEPFIARARDASLDAQKIILRDLVGYPLTEGSPSHALVTALDPELVRLWKAMKEARKGSTAPTEFRNYRKI